MLRFQPDRTYIHPTPACICPINAMRRMVAMANSRFEYVREYERETKLLPQCWAVVRLDGRCFTKFCRLHEFEKPNDGRGLHLMNAAAVAVMEELPDICLSFGESDEMSFVFHKNAKLYGKACYKWLTVVTSLFTGSYVHRWTEYFPETALQSVPCFDGRIVEYPTVELLRDYLSWRQVDTHINNQYNTCFWALVHSGMTQQEAQTLLKGTRKSDKNEMLFQRFGLNYNDVPEIYRKGSVLYREPSTSRIVIEHVDLIKENFWQTHLHILNTEKQS